VRIYYEEHGRGLPLVLAYGIGGNTQMWDTNVEALASRYRLILWEPRGHARSGSPKDPAKYSFARWTLDLRDLLDHLRIGRAVVGGLSLGGGIATRFTLRYPRRVAALIVTNSSSAAGLPLTPDSLIMRAQSIKITLEQGMDAMTEFATQANPNVAGRLALDPNAKAEFYAEYRALDPIGYANSLRALLAMDLITDRLSEIRVPTLLIGGDQDPSLAAMRVMHRRIRGSKLVVLSPAGHFGNRDQPESWNRAVLAFLANVDAKRR
jgi:pimeloyl-ACP methyl ester carboxylesterase